jgi:hypothetical protein
MSSHTTIQDIKQILDKRILPSVSHYHQEQVRFGILAYGLRPFQSLASGGRVASGNIYTARRKVERLFSNKTLSYSCGAIYDLLGLVKPSSLVNIDHSDMNLLTALVGAIQTKAGRAVPCLVETTYSHHIPADSAQGSNARTKLLRKARTKERQELSFTNHTIHALQSLHDRLGFWPKGLVFDRGFGNEPIISFLDKARATFYIRLKAGRYLESEGQVVKVRDITSNDQLVKLYDLNLRLVRSPKSRRAKEPWYILTNDKASARDKIVRIYYHRFEIEETFRDIKHILELRRTRINKPLSLKLLLWFVAMGIAILFLLSLQVYTLAKPSRTTTTQIFTQTTQTTHPKKQISWIRQGLESVWRDFYCLGYG